MHDGGGGGDAYLDAARRRAAEERARQGLPPLANATLGVIGGSGLYDIEGLEHVVEVRPTTPFGQPSDAIVVGHLGATRVAFLPRHARGHRLLPSEVPYRANLYALRLLGVGRVVSISACGSMREAIAPRDVVVPDQFLDRTKDRPATFFGGGVVAHVAFADPVCPVLSARLAAEAEAVLASTSQSGHAASGSPDSGARAPVQRPRRRVHRGGTYLAIEGPQFSTRAESLLYRSWGVSVIGMTGLPEAKLAREAELCYGMLAFATDYDCWHEDEEAVTVAQVVANLGANVAWARAIVARLAADPMPEARLDCGCGRALVGAVQTAPEALDRDRVADLRLLLGAG
ncbi:MAG TPA: S-methyl-5'-thioadenosine phosphorylase [Candidatus Limnocylindrales bacterium]